MSLLSGLAHVAGDVASPVLNGVGAVTGINSLTQTGHNIGAPNAVLTNPAGLFNANQAFSTVQPSGVQQKANSDTVNTGTTRTHPSSIYTGGGSGGGSTGGGVSGADLAQYNDQIGALQGLLSQADTAQNNGMNAYNQSYNNGLSRLNQSQSNVMSDYATQGDTAQKNFVTQKNGIDNNARNGYNSLMSLLAGSGSAADILAPLAVSTQANQQRSGAQDIFAQNSAQLDTAKKRAQDDYNNKMTDLLTQKNTGIQKLISDINAQKQNYLNQIQQVQDAKAGGRTDPSAINSQIAALQAQQNNLQNTYAIPTLSVDPVTAQPVNLADYQAQAAQLGGMNNQPDGSTDDTTAALAQLLKQNKDQSTSAYAY